MFGKPALIYAVAATTGPMTVDLLGYQLPLLSAGLSVLGVVLATVISPPPALSMLQRVALTALLVVLMLALVISDPARSPIMSTCWAIGIGYTGLPIIEAIGRWVRGRTGELTGEAQTSANDPALEDPKP